MDVLKALIQNCKMSNTTSLHPRSCLERHKLAKLQKRSQSSLHLVVLGAIMNTVYIKKEITACVGAEVERVLFKSTS